MDENIQRGMDLEKYIIRPNRWNEAPEDVRKFAEESRDDFIPTAIAHDTRDDKWYVLHSGQGPYVAYEGKTQ